MKVIISCILWSFLCVQGFSQQIGAFAGYCYSNFYDLAEEDPHFKASYRPGNGATVGIRIDRMRIIDKLMADTFHMSLALNFTMYSGQIKIMDGGIGSGRTLDMQAKKYIIGLDIIPLNVRIYKELWISAGGEFNYLIAHTEEGYQSKLSMNSGSTHVDLNDTTLNIYNPLNFGVKLNLKYNISLRNQLYIVPAYGFYLGLTNEFDAKVATIRSYRQYLNIGIARRL